MFTHRIFSTVSLVCRNSRKCRKLREGIVEGSPNPVQHKEGGNTISEQESEQAGGQTPSLARSPGARQALLPSVPTLGRGQLPVYLRFLGTCIPETHLERDRLCPGGLYLPSLGHRGRRQGGGEGGKVGREGLAKQQETIRGDRNRKCL